MAKKNEEEIQKEQETEETKEEQPEEASIYTRSEAIDFHKKQLEELEKQVSEEDIMKTLPEWRKGIDDWKITVEKAIADLQKYIKASHNMLSAIQDKIELLEKKKK